MPTPTNGHEPARDQLREVADALGKAVADAFYLLSWGFLDGVEPPAPGPDGCGSDLTKDELDCETELENCGVLGSSVVSKQP